MVFQLLPQPVQTAIKPRLPLNSWARPGTLLLVVVGLVALAPARGLAAENVAKLGSYRVDVPQHWKQQTPKSSIIAYEFWSPAADGDEVGGRMTVSSAGGSVTANLERWYSQFSQPDGQPSAKAAKVEQRTVAGQKVHLVDLSGTYRDRPNPMAPGVDRPSYRLLGAIIETDDANFFLKFYGPERTIAGERTAFLELVESLSKP